MSLSLIWKILNYVWLASEIYIAVATRTKRGRGNVRDRGTMLLLWVAIFTSITAGSWYGAMHESDVPDGMGWLKPVSLAILIAGLLLRWSAVVSLGKSFSANVAIHATQKVMKTGLYRWMRHPSYTGLLMCLLAVGLHTRNWIALLIVIVPTTAALLYRIHVEEIALREHFRQEYVEYSRVTKRLIPGIY